MFAFRILSKNNSNSDLIVISDIIITIIIVHLHNTKQLLPLTYDRRHNTLPGVVALGDTSLNTSTFTLTQQPRNHDTFQVRESAALNMFARPE